MFNKFTIKSVMLKWVLDKWYFPLGYVIYVSSNANQISIEEK